jgi:hypothetical protein
LTAKTSKQTLSTMRGRLSVKVNTCDSHSLSLLPIARSFGLQTPNSRRLDIVLAGTNETIASILLPRSTVAPLMVRYTVRVTLSFSTCKNESLVAPCRKVSRRS